MGSARFTCGGIGKVHRWWVQQGGGSVFGSYVVCGMGFQQIWRPTFSSLSHLTLSILGVNLKRIWTPKPILGLFYLFLIFDKFEKLICSMCWEGIFWVCGFVKGLFAVCVEKGSSGLVKGSFLGLWMRVFWGYKWEFVGFVKRGFSGYQLREKNVQILRLTLPRKCLVKFYFSCLIFFEKEK